MLWLTGFGACCEWLTLEPDRKNFPKVFAKMSRNALASGFPWLFA